MSVEFPYDWYGVTCDTFADLAYCYAGDTVPLTGQKYGLGEGGRASRVTNDARHHHRHGKLSAAMGQH